MQVRAIGTIAVSSALSTVAAVVYWHLMIPQSLGTSVTPNFDHLEAWYSTAPTAFIGSLIASCIFVARGARTLRWALWFVALSDIFAVLTFWIGSTLWQLPGAVMLGASIPNLIASALTILILGLTVANVVTRGVGFVMALPALAWLWFRHRPRPINLADNR